MKEKCIKIEIEEGHTSLNNNIERDNYETNGGEKSLLYT
jgi:hypothetical protein